MTLPRLLAVLLVATGLGACTALSNAGGSIADAVGRTVESVDRDRLLDACSRIKILTADFVDDVDASLLSDDDMDRWESALLGAQQLCRPDLPGAYFERALGVEQHAKTMAEINRKGGGT